MYKLLIAVGSSKPICENGKLARQLKRGELLFTLLESSQWESVSDLLKSLGRAWERQPVDSAGVAW